MTTPAKTTKLLRQLNAVLSEGEASREIMLSIIQALFSILCFYRDSIEPVLVRGLPWFAFLPAEDRRKFIAELKLQFASESPQSLIELEQFFREWKATAEIHADPKLAARLLAPLTGMGGSPVPKPRPN